MQECPNPGSTRRAGWPGGLASLSLVCAVLAVAACDDGDDAALATASAPEAVEAGPPEEEASPYDGIDLPPFEPLPLPPPELERPYWASRPSDPAPTAAAEGEDVEEPHASLDALLDLSGRVPRGAPAAAEPRALDLQDTKPAAPATKPEAAAEPGAIDRLKGQVHVGTRSEPIGPKGPRQGTHSETDAGIRVPLDESVSLEGGVRVDERKDPSLEEPDRKSTPRVGVEVRF